MADGFGRFVREALFVGARREERSVGRAPLLLALVALAKDDALDGQDARLRRDPAIAVVGEATTFSQVIQKAAELQPDEIIFDLHLVDGEKERLPAGPKLIAISFANDDEAKALAESIGVDKLLDKMELYETLIPAILELAPERATL